MFPEEIFFEILLRLPVETLAIFLCVSKLWLSIIRSRHFINAYQSRCSTRRQSRVMFALQDQFATFRWHFLSISQPSFVINAPCSVDNTSYTPYCVHGLICIEYMDQLWICNPALGKGVLLPQGPQSSSYKPFRTWYMGYDPISCQYKILFFSKKRLRCRYKVQVFTLGGGQGSWKMIEVGNVHSPVTRGVCIDGIVYYGAGTAHGPRLVRFYVATEKFDDFIEFPVEASIVYDMLFANYQGKLALVAKRNISKYDIWVLEDAKKQEWSKVSININREMCSYNLIWPGVVGFVAGSGDLIVTARDYLLQFHLVYVDLKKKCSRGVWLGGVRPLARSSLVLAFTDYVESIMLL
ncbi:hypothetical protein CARUB_v10027601mg [Capsella rubella]|uniref:F-box domain-containing protein n=1 Tax=Capsella rubella TaxID=81985 RepID=R0EZK1_9BRAS|nr:putative F-box protein At5g52610 [Capsella rubella]EOA14401.1 hypothetical protein CARUB_v10027601mg [Capsella rubella]